MTGQVERVVINDLDPAIHAFWRTLVEEPEYLQRKIQRAKLDATEWAKQRKVYLAADVCSSRSLGYATFYLNRTNRSGVLNAGPIGGHDQTGNYKIDARFNREGLSERIRILSLYADKIIVSSADGKDVIAKYAGKPKTFIYADPPYFDKAEGLYLNAFSPADHEALAKVLNLRAKENWVLTYDNVPQVAALYPERRRYEFELTYSAHTARKAKEVVVLSDALGDIGEGWPRLGG